MTELYQFFETGSRLVDFVAFEPEIGLPFPLYLDTYSKIVLLLFGIMVLAFGSRLRILTLQYLHMSNRRNNPINQLIWMDQLSGMCLGIHTLLFLFVAMTQEPEMTMINPSVCFWLPSFGNFYITGSTIWSALIALARTFYTKPNNVFIRRLGERKLLRVILNCGQVLHLFFWGSIMLTERNGVLAKMCLRFSNEDREIFETFQVSYCYGTIVHRLDWIFLSLW